MIWALLEGGTWLHFSKASLATWMALAVSFALAASIVFVTLPVAGLKTSSVRPDYPETFSPLMKCFKRWVDIILIINYLSTLYQELDLFWY